MDFRSMNKFNVIMNTLSGNFFPITGEKINLGFVCLTYLTFTWIIQVIYMLTTVIGALFYAPVMIAVREGGVSAILTAEIFIVVPYLTFRSVHLRNFIGKMNSVIVNSDDLRRCVCDSVEPHRRRLKIYTIATVTVTIMWTALPIFKLLKKDRHYFTYNDFVLPTYYPGAPFTVNIFVFAAIMDMLGAICLSCKKIGIDVYVSYLITLLAAEYKYVTKQIIATLSQINGKNNEKLVIASLQKCVKHHCIVMEAGQSLIEILSLNVALTYLNCILRFCLLGFSVFTYPDLQKKVICGMYIMSTMIQVYMLCLCGQELLEASTTVTDDAFYENWYERGHNVKSVFRTMGLGNRVKCQITAFGVVDLTIPTFGSILNQAYSFCLLLLRFS